jgi:ubiquinone/menaquinone biosynthesis C-methylase UbiE
VNKETVENFYTSDRFVVLNKQIEVDSPWKIEKLSPFVDFFLNMTGKKDLSVLDVGGGSGFVLKGVTEHIEHLNRSVRAVALDLSPGYLEVQRTNNPKLQAVHQCSLESPPFSNKEIDLLLLIDVLEHLYNLDACYAEMKRISKYVLMKVPLENNLSVRALELLTGYRTRRAGHDGVGHINYYDQRSLHLEVAARLGPVLKEELTDVFSYLLTSPERRRTLSLARVAYCKIAQCSFRISPHMTSRIFNDFVVLLIKCG